MTEPNPRHDLHRTLVAAAIGGVLLSLRRRWRSRHPEAQAGPPGETGDRGRGAETPSQIPARGWKDIAWRLYSEVNEDNISAIAAGVAFYALLAMVPALGALVSIYGLAADPGDIEEQVLALATVLPQEVLGIIREQLHRLVGEQPESLSWAAIGGIMLTLWSSTKGVGAMMHALNVAYDETEQRSFIWLTVMQFALTLGGIVVVLLSILLVVGVPAVVEALSLWGPLAWLVSLGRWPLLFGLLMTAMALLYRYGPSRDKPQWRWVTWGSVFATIVWIIGSIGFSVYVSNFGSYDKTYGSLGAVVIMMLWFWLSSYIVLVGAELNAEMEHQTAKDTTEGPPQPLGTRRAHVADTIGKASD